MVAAIFRSSVRDELTSTHKPHEPRVRAEFLIPEQTAFQKYQAQRKYYNESINEIYASLDDLQAKDITLSPGLFLASAQAVLEPTDKLPALDIGFGKSVKDRGTLCAGAFTFAVLPSRVELRDTAVIFSYQHHDLRVLNEAYSILNSARLSASPIAPRVLGYRDVALPNNRGYSGALLVVEGLKGLDSAQIEAQSYPQQRTYEALTLALREAVIMRDNKVATPKPPKKADNIIDLRAQP